VGCSLEARLNFAITLSLAPYFGNALSLGLYLAHDPPFMRFWWHKASSLDPGILLWRVTHDPLACLGFVTVQVNNLHLMRSRYPKLPIRERYQWPLANYLVLVKVDELSLMFWGGDNFRSNLDGVNIVDYHSCYYEQIVILSSFLRDLVQSKLHFRSRLSRWASSFFCWCAW